jgi:hypothetical protein
MRWEETNTSSTGQTCFHCNVPFKKNEKKLVLTGTIVRNKGQIKVHHHCFHHNVKEYTAPDRRYRICHICGKSIKKGEELYEKVIFRHKTRLHKNCSPIAKIAHRKVQLDKLVEDK